MGTETARRSASLRLAIDGPAARSLWAAAIAAVPLLLALHGVRWLAVVEAPQLPACVLAALLGVLAADLASGIVHWACDTWGDERTPWLGPGLIRAFREHHRDPGAIVRHDWVQVNRETGLAVALALLLLGLPPLAPVLEAHPAAWTFLLAALGWSAAANQVHRWAHMERPPPVARWAARAGLVLSRERHDGHHLPPFTGGYCIATGWLNPVLDGSGFWRGLEWAVSRTTGAVPRAHEGCDRLAWASTEDAPGGPGFREEAGS